MFDIIELRSTENIRFLSGPRGMPDSPQGTWIVMGAVSGELVCVKKLTTIRVPISDVIKVASFDPSKLQQMLDQQPDPNKADLVAELSKATGHDRPYCLGAILRSGLPRYCDRDQLQEILKKATARIKEETDGQA